MMQWVIGGTLGQNIQLIVLKISYSKTSLLSLLVHFKYVLAFSLKTQFCYRRDVMVIVIKLLLELQNSVVPPQLFRH